MLTTENFFQYAQWVSIAALAFGGLTLLAFAFKWGIRFRLVGVTGFTGVLAAGLFALGIVPFTRVTIPGAVRFATVFDSGSTQAVIVVPQTITPTELEATLRQAASDLFSPGRLGQGQSQLTIRARTVLHPEPGLSQPLYLGQVKRSLFDRNDENLAIELNPENLAKLPASPNADIAAENS